VKTKKTKRTYRLRNWKQYNSYLVNRGGLTIWVSQDVIKIWRNHSGSRRRGKPRVYSDAAILCLATLGEVYNLPLRQTEGLMASIIELLQVELAVPDYSTLCRRRRRLGVCLPKRKTDQPLHLVVDATGVKVYGEGEWKVRQHGYTKRRTWRKLHIGVNEASREIVAAVVATNNFTDGQVLPDLLEQIDEKIEQVSGDGSYDKRNCYEAIRERKARAAIPPQKGARIWRHGNSKAERLARDENLRRIRQVGRRQWKQESGYHRRSLAETTMMRLKTIFGERVRGRRFEAQASQMIVRCAALNMMTHLGMPDSYAV
jgi:IS5 family transposase